ncbi:leucine--tRNA ligase [uncultured Dokdonia sp.]|uniref:leucine--tRNA ligase n=1 Tax=uncultured Dokdonia sp. TaxID=575653 RepID=UPI0030EB4EF1|tara:strand:- start:5201 stop:8467 length:3267 start_codon:yes stop_codon:yes gene_type:complete
MKYHFNEIEARWQQYWADKGTFHASNNSDKPKYYVLDMFPYPSGAGLHVGHPLGYIASDVYSRYKRLKGFNVLHPQGYDSFGLPAEQYAIQTGQHPAVTTKVNIEGGVDNQGNVIAGYRKQLDKIGFSFDWSREVRTSNPEYYKWTQWIFTELFNSWYNKDTDKAEAIETLVSAFAKTGNAEVNAACDDNITPFTAEQWNAFTEKEQQDILLQYRLTYLAETEVNWCPALGTVLANDEIVNGVSERGGHTVIRKKMTQWSMRISAYAERLIQGLEGIDWSESIKETQRNWIGKSVGAMVTFPLAPKGGTRAGYLTGGNNAALLLERAKEMRENPTPAEAALWESLKSKNLGDKFRRQHPIDAFIPDFVCLSKKLIIEVDGGIHDTQVDQDEERTAILEDLGYTVLRFRNEEVLANLEEVLETITAELNNKIVPPSGARGIDVFTTRPDTIFGVSFMTLAPEHELVAQITTPEQKEAVAAYIEKTAKRSERERMADVKTISGVFTGAYAEHPFTKKPIPVWIGDYVLAGYGTGAVMAVPCGDQRDYDFAKKFDIAIPNVFEGVDISEEAFSDKATTVITNSDFLNGLKYKKAVKLAIYELEKIGAGAGKTNYRLRDAVFSRQRYWGEPFPVYYENGIPKMIDVAHLPIKLPEVEKYLPTEEGEPPLGRADVWAWDTKNNKVVSNDLVTSSAVEKSQNGIYPLELNTMPGWAGSSWYFFRYMEKAQRDEVFASKEAMDYWGNVDLYIGGSEHGTGHLLYSRFWVKFLKDRGHVGVDEPFQKMINQGMILGTSAFVYREEGTSKFLSAGLLEGKSYQAIHVDVSLVNASDELDVEAFKNWREEFKNAEFILEDGVYKVGREVEKMSKSKYNVVNPDQICEQYGADTLRMYEMFLGPLEQAKPWNTAGITGVHNFLKKFWKLYHNGADEAFNIADEAPSKESLKTLHKTIKKVEEDIENFSFNTSVSTFMIAVNELGAQKCTSREVLESLVILIAPYAPHIAEELYSKLGHSESISEAAFPIFDASHLVESAKNYPISFNGKMKFTLELPLDLSKDEIEKIVMANEKTQMYLDGRTPKKVIIVPGKIVNIVG